MTTHRIEKSLILAATPSKVWTFLTDPDKLAIWFHRPDVPLGDPQAFSMPGADGAPLCWGAVEEARAPEYLRYSFTARPMQGLMTTVTWTLTPVEAGTRLSLVHDGIPTGHDSFGLLTAFDAGWDAHLARFRDGLAPIEA